MSKATDERYDPETGLPIDQSYLECDLPPDLVKSIQAMVASWAIVDSGQRDMHWDLNWCDLMVDINAAEREQKISPEQAWYLRDKYLRIIQED